MRRAVTALLLAGSAAPVAAQRDTVVVAGERYEAHDFHRMVLGAGYREAWEAPVRIPFLDLDTVAGGLTPTEPGGGNQTRSLRFRGANGREYALRSVDKDPVRTMGPDVHGTLAGGILQDLVSAQFPSGQLAVSVLEDALGILYAPRRLYVMPDDPRLGEFREDFAGMLGYWEERPAQGATGVPGLAGASAIEGTEEFYTALREGPRNRLDARGYLTVRLLDLVIGDWDRHDDQFRWAAFDQGGMRVWRPVPRDRDYAFVNYGGLVAGIARKVYPKVVRFGPDPRGDLFGLFQNAQQIDRRLLGELPREAWDSAAGWVRARLTDEVIGRAVSRLPDEYRRLYGDFIARRLRERRDHLPAAAAQLYAWMAIEPNAHATDRPERVTAERREDGTLELSFAADGQEYFRRRYLPGETREVRVFLYGGDDRMVVRGAGPGRIGLRVVGGDGDDLLADSSARGDTHFYDHAGANRFDHRGRRGGIDARVFSDSTWSRERGTAPPREWGRSRTLIAPAYGWRARMGPVLGARTGWVDYGFRRRPFEDRGSVSVLYSPLENRFGAEYAGAYHFTGDRRWLDVQVRATQLVGTDFHDFGNLSPPPGDVDEWRFFERQLLVEPTWHFPLGERSWLRVGPTLEWRDPEPEPVSIALLTGAPGSEEWGALGGRVGLDLDLRDNPAFPRRGFRFALSADAFPAVHRLDGAFGGVEGVASTYLWAGAGPVLALRAGGRLAWGDFPLQRAATLGGRGSLRGHRSQRFAGDAAAFGGAEVRLPVVRANLGLRGTLGVLGVADAGRVWVDGDSPGDWHTAAGGGLYFNFYEHRYTATVYVVSGEVTRTYAQLGIPF